MRKTDATFALIRSIAAIGVLAASSVQAHATQPACPAFQDEPLLPKDPALCARLEPIVRRPGALRLDIYEKSLDLYLKNFCHRDATAGWHRDKRVRDTGPFTLSSMAEVTTGHDFGTHSPVVVWYSRDMFAWLKAARAEGAAPAKDPPPIPEGAMMVKEMFPEPAAVCAGRAPENLKPTSGAAVMVRDSATSKDGWFWGWYGWTDLWKRDWSDLSKNAYPLMGFGQYCLNCHASARDSQTFASLRNIKDEAGEPLVYLTQSLIPKMTDLSKHQAMAKAPPLPATPDSPGKERAFLDALGLSIPPPVLAAFPKMPSATFDNVWARPNPHRLAGFVTSDQCLGCHDAGGTGLQFDMVVEGLGDDKRLYNMSPYATWRSSPMGMAGRDPIFLAQLASETDTFHNAAAPVVQDTCLGCHGILGQRAFKTGARAKDGVCRSMARADLDVTPFEQGDPLGDLADYAGLARDGVSCVACHRMALGAEAAKVHGQPQNACIDQRRALLTPGLKGFAASFTGSFDMGPADTIKGPFDEPREMPMKHALGMQPKADTAIRSSEVCGTCHTVHLPILHRGATLGHIYEQTTYAEWAFSAYRTGTAPDGALPLGAGAHAQSCQGCHMSSHEPDGSKTTSKIASIQEYSNFPATENTLPADKIDLQLREGFARHTLVGLNMIFVKMAQQFPVLLGMRKQDPMMLDRAVDPIDNTDRQVTRQAAGRTAKIAVADVATREGVLDATVTVTNLAGHKFPSGVGFRRAFVEVKVKDASGAVLWVSGQTNAAGVILDGHGAPLTGELWWKADCSARLEPQARHHQPHHETISRDDEVQVYEELTAAPGADGTPVCRRDAPPQGPLTTSFLSRCTTIKDNRLLPAGFLGVDDRAKIATALGAERDLAEEAGPAGVGDDPDYVRGGGDTVRYRIPLSRLGGQRPASIEATLYYQSTPPYYLQDRACTSPSTDAKRLTYLAANLDLAGSPAAGWKLKIGETARAAVP